MNQHQSQKQNQQLKRGYYMSQQHMKLMHIMHLSGYALQEYIANELEQNPVLEAEDQGENQEEPEVQKETEFDNELMWNKDDEDLFEKNYKQPVSNEDYYEAPVIQFNSLQENLKEQIHMMNLTDEMRNIICYLVDELDDDGYLRRDINDVIDDYAFLRGKMIQEEKMIDALHLLQKCEPAGVGARNLHECLLIQLKRKTKKCPTREKCIRIFEDHYQNFVQRNFHKIKSDLNITGEEFESCMNYIKKLNPKPITEANKYELIKEQIIPDFEVTIEDSDLYIALTSSEFTKLRVNPEFSSGSLATNTASEKKQAENYFQTLVSDAQVLINALKERETTMMKIITVIVQMQPDFFKSGDIQELRPMILQDISNRTGFDISTISRITSNKHVQTPFGIFSLKNLFMRALVSESDGSSSTAIQVQDLIQKIVKEENKLKPLSDTDIMNLLKQKDVNIARRTVVKYRELLGIPNSTMRKKEQMVLN
ncbi:MAG: polymerase sigma54 factor [Bacteroidota bacterium]|nr:polymerase sigma54 factor [Bacteroidota bacterium]